MIISFLSYEKKNKFAFAPTVFFIFEQKSEIKTE